jgi:hypothetical protein
MSLAAFQVSGLTQQIAATSAGSAAVQVSTGNQQATLLSNPSTQPIYFVEGSSSVQAAFPTTAASAMGACVLAGRERVFTTRPQGWLSAASSAGSVAFFATPGNGQ